MFDVNGKLWDFMSKVTNLILLNLLFILFSLPVITIGASKSALYDLSSKVAKGEEESILRSFVERFVMEFKQSTSMWLIYLIAMTLVGVNMSALLQSNVTWVTTILMTISSLILFIVNGTFSYAIVLNVHFTNTIKNNIKNGCALTIARLPQTILILILEWMPLILLFFFTNYFLYILTFYFVIGFALSAYVSSYLYDQVIRQIKG
ncbi:DUF624 domain-containing protein [Fusibacter bizertensis]